MSMELMVKAMKVKLGSPIKKLVLIKLADNANDKGECWPSYQHIADHCEVDKRTVMRHIKSLSNAGYINITHRKGEKGNSSNIFRLNIPSDPLSPPSDRVPLGGDPVSPPPSDPVSPRTSHSIEPVKEPVNEAIDRFDEFWEIYDKKTGKPKCQSKWKKLKQSDVEKIFKILPTYIQSTPDKQYRKNPLTWLNGECWNDEIQVFGNNQQSIHNLSGMNYESGDL